MGNSHRGGMPSSDDLTYLDLSGLGGSTQGSGKTKTSGKKGGQSSSSKAGKESKGTSRRGFASMDAAKQREIASKGGQASGGNFKHDPKRAAAAGRIGGSR